MYTMFIIIIICIIITCLLLHVCNVIHILALTISCYKHIGPHFILLYTYWRALYLVIFILVLTMSCYIHIDYSGICQQYMTYKLHNIDHY